MCGFCRSAFPHVRTLPHTVLQAAAAGAVLVVQEAPRQPHPYPTDTSTACSYCSASEHTATCTKLLLLPQPGSLAELGTCFLSNTWSQAFMCSVRNPKVRGKSEQSSTTVCVWQLLSLSISFSITSCRSSQGSEVSRVSGGFLNSNSLCQYLSPDRDIHSEPGQTHRGGSLKGPGFLGLLGVTCPIRCAGEGKRAADTLIDEISRGKHLLSQQTNKTSSKQDFHWVFFEAGEGCCYTGYLLVKNKLLNVSPSVLIPAF